MPRSMTMNGHHTEATAPLDLRVTVRQRGGGEDSVKDRYGDSRVTAEVSVESPAALRTVTLDGETRTHGVGSREHPNVSVVKPLNDMGNPARSDSKHSPMARSSSPSTSRSPKWTISSGETVAAHRRVLDRSSSSLPFRKRQFPTEGQSQHDKPGVSDCLTPERDTGSCHRPDLPKVLKRDEQKGKDCALRSSASAGLEETEPRLHGFTYSHYPRYPVYDWSAMSPLTHSLSLPPSLAPPLPLQAQQLLEDIALATHQDEDGDTALHIAVVKGEELLVCRLIYLLALAHKDLDTNNNLRQTPLHLAVITNQPPLVEALLRAGADSGALDRHGQTVLHLCCEYGQLGCLAVILSQASPPSPASYLEIRNFEGLTPLHLAVQGGHKELARLLLDAGADINAMDIKSGQSPLMHAVESSNADMVHFLIENVCDVNGQSYSGNTALHSACGRGQVDTVRLLLKSGADSSLKNYHNDTPVMVARNKRVTAVLRGKGPKLAKTLEQQSASASPQTSTPHRVNGSVSPNSSLGRSRSATPLLSHHSASQSPRAPPTSSPHSQSTDSLSSRQSPMGAQEREPVRLGSNVAGADLLSQGRAFQLPLYLPALHQSPLAESHLGVLMPSHPAYSTPGAPGPRYPDAPYILLSHQVSIHHPSQMNPRELRPLSRGSDQSDISTMSVSSGGKVDS